MTETPAHEVLRRLFDVIVSEAKTNEPLARKLVAAFGEIVPADPSKPQPAPRKQPIPAAFHAINVLRSHGEGALRGKLEQVRELEGLRSIASASGLVLTGGAAKPKASRAELIDGIIAAAKHYDAQRSTAAGLTDATQAT
jgi:hypothetical protein